MNQAAHAAVRGLDGRRWQSAKGGYWSPAWASVWVCALMCTTAAAALAAAPPAELPELRFAPERDYGPFVYETAQGEVAGLSVDLLRLIQSRTGLHVRVLPAKSLKEQLALLRAGQVDLLSSLRPTPERAAFLRFTQPYVEVPAVLMVRDPGEAQAASWFNRPLQGLEQRPVAVGAGYAVESFVRSAYPRVLWQSVSDDVVALRGVAEGRFDGAVVDAASASFVIQQHGLRGLQSAGEVGFVYALCFAVPVDRPDWQAWLNQAIQELPRRERQAVVSRWLLPLGAPPAAGRLSAWLVAAGGLLGLALWTGLWLWRRRAAGRRAA